MPGIAGILGAGRAPECQAALPAMLNSMRHKPNHDFATHVDERLGLWSGWLFDNSRVSQSLPVWNERKDVCLIFSGEHFADAAEIERLDASGHHFDQENAAYVVQLYEQLGIKFLEKLNGAFRGLLVDFQEQKIVLFNDRYGLNRVYFCENEDGFYFSSEAKALLKVLPEVRRLDPGSLGEFLSCGCVLQNRTLFSGISLLPPGSAWVFSPGQPVKKQSYFNPKAWEQQPTLDPAEYYERLKTTWKRLLPRYFRASDRVALSLTGGVDSRMILAWAPHSAGTLPCYTFGGRYRDCMDVKVARQVARVCRQPHHVIPINAEFLSEFPPLAEKAVYLSDGAMDVTGAIDLYVQRKAQEIAPVRITGTTGGEMLRRLVVFKPGRVCPQLLAPELTNLAREAATTYATELQGHRLSFTAFKQAPWFMGPKFALERFDVRLRMPYFDNDLVALLYQAPTDLIESNEVSLRLIADGNTALGRIATDRGGSFRLLHDFSFKAEYAYDYGMPQWLARLDHALSPLHLERLFLGRHKICHFRIHYRDELAHYLKDVLLDSRSLGRPYLQGRRVADIVNGHLGGSRNHTLEIHKLLTLELIQRRLIEQN